MWDRRPELPGSGRILKKLLTRGTTAETLNAWEVKMRLHGRARMLAGSIVTVLALSLMASAATPGSSNTSDPRDKLNVWEDRWKEQVETKETPYSHAASVPSHITCAWTADRGFMVCEYLSEKIDPAGVSRPTT